MIGLVSYRIVDPQTTLHRKIKKTRCGQCYTFLITRQAGMTTKRLARAFLTALLQNINIALQLFRRISTSLAAERIFGEVNKLRGNHRFATSTRSHQILLDLKRARGKK